jgi:hypothetical protein
MGDEEKIRKKTRKCMIRDGNGQMDANAIEGKGLDEMPRGIYSDVHRK